MKRLVLFALACGLAGCPGPKKNDPPPLALDPAADQKARADLQASIDDYVRTAPRIADYRLVLNPNMYALQGDAADPVPTHLGLLVAAPPPAGTGLDAFDPVVVKAAQARLRDALHREPTDDEVTAEIQTAESGPHDEIVGQLEARASEIAAIYADAATLARGGKADQAAARLDDARKLREGVISAWQLQNGIAAGKPDDGLTPEQIVAADRERLADYLNHRVEQSP